MGEADAEIVVFYYIDSYGFTQELKVTRETARGLDRILRSYRRAVAKWEERHRPFTDLESRVTGNQPDPDDAESLARSRARQDYIGEFWEGPRFRFGHLIGESMIWPLGRREDGKCPACLDRPLTPDQCCLWCDVTGKDLVIGRPTREDLRRRRRLAPRADDGLAGGTGKGKAKGKTKGRGTPARK